MTSLSSFYTKEVILPIIKSKGLAYLSPGQFLEAYRLGLTLSVFERSEADTKKVSKKSLSLEEKRLRRRERRLRRLERKRNESKRY